MPLNVAVVAGGGFQGQGLIEAIHAIPGARAIVVDSTSDAIGEVLADRYVKAPPFDAGDAFDAFLAGLVAEEAIDLVLPATQRELRRLAQGRALFEQAGARVAVCPSPLLDILLDKRALYAALADGGIAVPALEPLVPEAPFPLFGRPRSGWGGQGNLRLDAFAQVEVHGGASLAESHAWVRWEERFEEFSADFAIDFDGRLSPVTVRRRVRTSGGFAVVSQSVEEPEVRARLQPLAQWLQQRDARGLFNVQLLRLPDGKVQVSDVNPRHGTSSGHALAEGNALVAFLLGQPAATPARPVRTLRLLEQRAVPLLREVVRGVVFDLDDTLIDHKQWMLERMELACDALAGTVVREQVLTQTYIALEEGEHARLIDVVAAGIGRPDLRDRLLTAYRAAVPARAVLYPEVRDVLRSLRGQGLRLALLTDNPPASQRAKLAAASGLADAFDALVFAREHGAEKPDRKVFDAAAVALDLPARALLMAGDNPARDALGAIGAGYASCLLVCRPGSRFQMHGALLARCAPGVAARTWTAPDLRALPLALRLPAY